MSRISGLQLTTGLTIIIKKNRRNNMIAVAIIRTKFKMETVIITCPC
jgi:hypothetical protein